ncbi:MAG: YybH family protein [Candidatus Aminicenantia bacterium]
MKKFLICFLSIGFLSVLSCQKAPTPVDIEAEKALIKAVLESYVKSIEDEDMELYAQNMAHNPEMVNFGGFGDPIIGWDALKKAIKGQNEALSETKITVSDLKIHVSEDGKFGWATCLWDLKAIMGENPIELPIRCTWILEKQENRWIIVHWHKSMAMTG